MLGTIFTVPRADAWPRGGTPGGSVSSLHCFFRICSPSPAKHTAWLPLARAGVHAPARARCPGCPRRLLHADGGVAQAPGLLRVPVCGLAAAASRFHASPIPVRLPVLVRLVRHTASCQVFLPGPPATRHSDKDFCRSCLGFVPRPCVMAPGHINKHCEHTQNDRGLGTLWYPFPFTLATRARQ